MWRAYAVHTARIPGGIFDALVTQIAPRRGAVRFLFRGARFVWVSLGYFAVIVSPAQYTSNSRRIPAVWVAEIIDKHVFLSYTKAFRVGLF